MKLSRLNVLCVLVLLGTTAAVCSAQIARVGDVTRLQGQGRNVLVGYGLVTGLQSTGDGDKFRPTMDALAAMITRFGADVASPADIGNAKNVAIVMLEVVLPEHGAREGDLLDVSVSAVAAKSLEGGRLLPTPLVYHDRHVEGLFGFGQGSIMLSGSVETHGIIRNGARIERDVFMNVVTTGAELRAAGLTSPWIEADETYVTLVLDTVHAGWSMAAAVAQAVDKELGVTSQVERLALAVDSKNIVVLVPRHQRGDPASWIRDVEQTALLMESNEARVTVNRNAGTIVITGDTRISPVIVSQKGMTITVIPSGEVETAARPVIPEADFVPVDVAAAREANVKDLLEALNRLKVPFPERVSILEEIHRAGKLHAKIVYEG